MSRRIDIELARYTFKSIFVKGLHKFPKEIFEQKLSALKNRSKLSEESIDRILYMDRLVNERVCLSKTVEDAKSLILCNKDKLAGLEQTLFISRLSDMIGGLLISKGGETDREHQKEMFDYEEIKLLSDWVKGISELQMDEKISEKPNTITSAKEIEKITKIYNFCIDTGVISNSISNVNFINAVNNANFKNVFANAEQRNAKSKCKYIIYVLSSAVSAENWYQNTARSINTEPNKCSGINVPSDWKRQAKALK